MDLLATYILGALLVAAAIGLEIGRSRRSEQIIRQWAEQGNYRLLLTKRPLRKLGPFYWTKSRQQTVYRVEVQNSDGQVQKAWIRCGNWWTGVSSGDIEVRWDD